MIATPLSQIKLAPGSAMTISGLTWKAYETVLQELGDNRLTRIAYNHGTLEIRMPGELHEIINRLLAKIITLLAMESSIEANDFGSITLNRQDLDRGIEPDTCFYIQNAEQGQGMASTATESLPPDLALEVDIANASTSKLSIYQAIGIPEIWLYRQNCLSIQRLQNGEYVETANSLSFPQITSQQLNQWLEMRKTETDVAVLRDVQQFCRAQR
jgi:Uma2 family endonuclease